MPKIQLVNGQRYHATISLGYFEGWAGNDTIKAKLVDAGFFNVVVTGSGRSRTAYGVWGGQSQSADLPDQISNVVAV